MEEYVLGHYTLSLILKYQVDISFVTSFTTLYNVQSSSYRITLQNTFCIWLPIEICSMSKQA